MPRLLFLKSLLGVWLLSVWTSLMGVSPPSLPNRPSPRFSVTEGREKPMTCRMLGAEAMTETLANGEILEAAEKLPLVPTLL
jgi:hypothetical protein